MIETTRDNRAVGVLPAAGIWAAAAALTWACIIQAVSSYYAPDRPQTALRWASGNPEALSQAALKFSESGSATDRAEAERYARYALIAAPLDVRALRVLAFEADAQNDAGRARRLMEAAGARTWRDALTQSWLLDDALERRDFNAASLHADAILRSDIGFENLLFPVMIQTLQDRRGFEALVARLAEGPDWGDGLLRAVAKQDAGRAETLFNDLASVGAPPTEAETEVLIEQMVAAGDYGAARAEWARLLPRGTTSGSGPLYDGAFRPAPGGPPFGWRPIPSQGAFAEFDQADEGGPALHVQAPAVRETPLIEQLLVLAPGSYRLSGEARVEADAPDDRFAWRIACSTSDTAPVAETVQAAGNGKWQPFSVGFDVPSRGCDAQWLRLSGLAHEGFEPTEAWFRTIRIEPIAAT